jgi:NTE family protein
MSGLSGLGDHTMSSAPLRRWLRRTTLLRRLEDGVLPLVVVTTDLETGDEVFLDYGPAVPALMASCAVPGIFPPVRLDGRWLVDGSVATDTPIGPAIGAGANRVFVLQGAPTVPMARPKGALDVMLRSTSIMLARYNAASVTTWADECELYVVPAPLVPGVSPFSFKRSEELIESAYRLTCEWLEDPRPVQAFAPGGHRALAPARTPAGTDTSPAEDNEAWPQKPGLVNHTGAPP